MAYQGVREEQRMEIIQELIDLERERDKEATRLRRKARQAILRINFSQIEEGYIQVKGLHNRTTSRIDDWIKLLEVNDDGEPTFPDRGMPGARYNPDNQELAMKDSQLEEIFTSARDALSNFVISLPAHEQPYIVQESTLPFLKNLEAIKAYCDRNPNSNPDDQEEEDDTETIVNIGNNPLEENPATMQRERILMVRKAIQEMMILITRLFSLQETR